MQNYVYMCMLSAFSKERVYCFYQILKEIRDSPERVIKNIMRKKPHSSEYLRNIIRLYASEEAFEEEKKFFSIKLSRTNVSTTKHKFFPQKS